VGVGVRPPAAEEENALMATIERNVGLRILYTELAGEAEQAANADELIAVAHKAYEWRRGVTGEY
jgi:hypothetical protein